MKLFVSIFMALILICNVSFTASAESDRWTYPCYNGNSYSIVDALDNLGIDSSYKNRERIAEANDISDYQGSAEQNLYLLALLKEGRLIDPDSCKVELVNYYPAYYGTSVSIVDALIALDIDHSFEHREKIANVNNITNYVGSASQNEQLLSLLKEGRLVNPDMKESISSPPLSQNPMKEEDKIETVKNKLKELGIKIENFRILHEWEKQYWNDNTASDPFSAFTNIPCSHEVSEETCNKHTGYYEAYQCLGFAQCVTEYLFNSPVSMFNPDWETHNDYNAILPGDVINYLTENRVYHWVIVVNKSGDDIEVMDVNADNKCGVRTNAVLNLNSMSNVCIYHYCNY